MTQCLVLRCSNLAAKAVNYNGGGLPLQVAVCDQHNQEISDGAAWAVQTDLGTHRDAILMGKDLVVAGLIPLTTFKGWNEDVGYPPETMQLEFEAVDGTPTKFLVTHEVARNMAAVLSLHFGSQSQGDEDPAE